MEGEMDIVFSSDAKVKPFSFGAMIQDDVVQLPRSLGKRLGRHGVACHDLPTLIADENADRIGEALKWPKEHAQFAQQSLAKVARITAQEPTARYNAMVFLAPSAVIERWFLWDDVLFRMKHDASWRSFPHLTLVDLLKSAKQRKFSFASPPVVLARRRFASHEAYRRFRKRDRRVVWRLFFEEVTELGKIALYNQKLWHQSNRILLPLYGMGCD